MSEKNTNEPAVRGEEPELKEEALEEVSGGLTGNEWPPYLSPPTLPIIEY